MTWLLAVPLLRRVLETGAQGLPQWLYQWRRGESPVEACLAELIAGGWLQPLFHSLESTWFPAVVQCGAALPMSRYYFFAPIVIRPMHTVMRGVSKIAHS